MKRKGWADLSPTNPVGTVGGCCEEGEAVTEELLETWRAGPGEAARREMAVGVRGPAPSRWPRRTMRAAVDWLTAYTVSGVGRLRQSGGLGLHTSCARWFSPDPDYRRKGRRLPRCLRAAARHPDTVVAVFLDEWGSQRWPEVAPTWGVEAAVAPRAGNPQQGRTIGALNARTGQGNSLAGDLVGRQHGRPFSSRLDRAYPEGDLIYGIQDHGSIHTPPDVLTALQGYPRITPGWLPTSAPWLKPIEKLWRWLRPEVLTRPRWGADWPQVKQRVHDFLDQFAPGSAALLRYVGLKGKGQLATIINTS
jgi:hypothetical protein